MKCKYLPFLSGDLPADDDLNSGCSEYSHEFKESGTDNDSGNEDD